MIVNKSLAVCITLSAGTILLGGCVTESGSAEWAETEDGEEVANVSQAISSDFTDYSGKVRVRIVDCGYSSPGAHPNRDCTLDPDFVLVGGGAEIEWQNHPGALLTASYPDQNFTTWHASSKDHVYAYPHKLRAYAIGLRLEGVPATTLRNYVIIQSNTVGGNHPQATQALPPGYTLIGGGARANYQSAGILLTGSYPDGVQWVATGKDHIVGESSGSIDAFAIGISSGYIPGFGYIETFQNSASTWVSSSYGYASQTHATGWVLASVGARSDYNGAGRLLTDIIPFVDTPLNTKQGAWVSTKDHGVATGGSTRAYTLSIRKRP